MKFFTALTSALAFTTTAIAAPLATNETEPFSLEARAGAGTPLQNTGITVFHSKGPVGTTGRSMCRFRMMGFLHATGAMFDILSEHMGAAPGSDPTARASVVAQSFFANLRPWFTSTFPDTRAHMATALFNTGSTPADAGWEGTVGAQWFCWADQDTYDKILEALKAYLSGKGSTAVDVVFSAAQDAWAVGGSPKEYRIPFEKKLKARSDTCSSGTSLVSQFQNRVPELPNYSGPEC
ncbi:hypothetical protein SLS58_005468 [Diplodia intermedia]|uniref:Uncharacterized protein n=1 Tax=Diplodia intermedia TaxID=856260 RepID=A0ABR3TR72_9PEZI